MKFRTIPVRSLRTLSPGLSLQPPHNQVKRRKGEGKRKGEERACPQAQGTRDGGTIIRQNSKIWHNSLYRLYLTAFTYLESIVVEIMHINVTKSYNY